MAYGEITCGELIKALLQCDMKAPVLLKVDRDLFENKGTEKRPDWYFRWTRDQTRVVHNAYHANDDRYGRHSGVCVIEVGEQSP